VNSLEEVQHLYDQNRYLEAFRQSADFWKPATIIEQLSTDQLILGSRLAHRLGGSRLSRALLRAAARKDPSNTRVRYFACHLRTRGWHLLDELRALEQQPDLGGEDIEARASWFAVHACRWAALRDFDHAHRYIESAHRLKPEDGWVLSCESTVFGREDRWEEALESAEIAWRLSRGAPYAAWSLSASLLALRKADEAATRLERAAEQTQSWEIASLACWHLCALTETLPEEERCSLLSRARHLAGRLPGLAPLADRETRRLIAHKQLDIAQLADDHAAMAVWSKEVHSPFYDQVLANLRSNPSGMRTRLPLRHAVQKHDACLPTSLASALAAMGTSISPDSMTAEITFGGTHEWAAAEWLTKRGLAVRFFIVTPETAKQLIKGGIAFTMSSLDDDSAHAVAVVGLDEAAGTLLVHDPRMFRTALYLVDAIGRGEAPLGPTGMAAVPRDKAMLLDDILPKDAGVADAAQAYYRAVALGGAASARPVVEEMSKQFPGHTQTRLLEARDALSAGRTAEALAGFAALLQAYPESARVRIRVLDACRSLANTALLRQTLKSIVDTGVIPGMQSEQTWVYPPARYVCEYAEILRHSASAREKARSLLKSVLRRQIYSAEAWHALADLLQDEGDTDGALLAYRLASCLADINDHYARAYVGALVDAGRETEGLQWLARRTQKYRNVRSAFGTWITWIRALEGLGHPEEALAACEQALTQSANPPEFLGFAIPLLARMGHWQQAEDLLAGLGSAGNRAVFEEAAVHFYRMRGDPQAALLHAEAWMVADPRSEGARHVVLEVTTSLKGAEAALVLASRWKEENPGHEGFEDIYCQQLVAANAPDWRKQRILLRRVRRNPEDASAWRELTFDTIQEYEQANEKKRAKLAPKIIGFLAECDRTGPDTVPTLRAHARWYEARGLRQEAVQVLLESIRRDPEGFYSYQRVWECSSTFDAESRRQVWHSIEPLLLTWGGPLTSAREMMGLLADRFGIAEAEEAISRWKEKRHEDPEVLEAYADLLLEHGHGRSDTERALKTLKDVVEHFPYHLGIRFSLANAHRSLGEDEQAEQVLHEILRRHPGNTAAQIQLAWIAHRSGNAEAAKETLDSLETRNPLDTSVWDARACMLMQTSAAGAVVVIEDGLRALPRDVGWRNRAISLLIDCGAYEKAIEAAREGTRIFPRGAFLWLLLGRTLNRLRSLASPGEIELCFRQSIRFNFTLFAAADELSTLLAEQRHFDEAEQGLRLIEPLLADPSPARGRLAWLKRERGQKREALQDLATVVQSAPWYRWGWGVLIEWLLEDQAWEQARTLLGGVIPELRTEVDFRVQRLQLLEKAGIAAAALDLEWNDLLWDFPRDTSLYVLRYDSLHASHRLQECADVLAAIHSIHPNDVYILARLAEVQVSKGEKPKALETALRVWFASLEESTWPANKVWEVLKNAGMGDELCRVALAQLQAGQKPTPRALWLMASHAMKPTIERDVQPFATTLFPKGGAREVLGMLEAVARSRWSDSVYIGSLLELLNDYGYQRLVLKYWKLHRDQLEPGVEPWAQTGRALAGLERKREVRRHLSDWRERPGVTMWIVGNYVLSFSGVTRADLQEVSSTCSDALTKLPHDHCASFLVHLKAEVDALLGDEAGLLRTWTTYESYFDTALKQGEFFGRKQRYLLGDIPTAVRLLQQNEMRLYRSSVRTLLWKRRLSTFLPAETVSAFSEVPWWAWCLFLFCLVLVVVNSFQQ
jgi:tetratricopeptide (TPR) repeat protein